jgi:hypothetical protein
VTELRDGTQDTTPAATREQSRPAEATRRQPAETMSREEYADHMRQGPAAEIGDQRGQGSSQQTADDEWQHQGEHAQGMTREEYADYMRQGPAAGGDEPPSRSAPENTSQPATDGLVETNHQKEATDQAPAPETRETIPDENQEQANVSARTTNPDAGAAQDVQQTPANAGDDQPFPTPEEREHGRAAYQQWRSELSTGWGEGVNVVGEKPTKSPGDISGLPPTGEQLMKMESENAPTLEKLGNMFDRDFGDIHDAAENIANPIQMMLDHPPTGATTPVVGVDTRQYWTPTPVAHAAPDTTAMMDLGLALVVVGDRAARWFGHKLSERRREADASH